MASRLRGELTSYMKDYQDALNILSLPSSISSDIAHAEREVLRITAGRPFYL
jgi:hypothetical protein